MESISNDLVSGLLVVTLSLLTAVLDRDLFDRGPRTSSGLVFLVLTLELSLLGTFVRVLTLVLQVSVYLTLGFPKMITTFFASWQGFPQHVGVRLGHESVLSYFFAISLLTGTSVAGYEFGLSTNISLYGLARGPGEQAIRGAVLPFGGNEVSGPTSA